MVTDNFNRANGSLGANWTDQSSPIAPHIVSNEASGNGAGVTAAFWSAQAWNSAHSSQFVYRGSAANFAAPTVRAQAGANSWYGFFNNGTLQKCTAGTRVTLATFTGYVAGDTAKLTVNGTTLECFVNGGSVGSHTDASFSGGSAGIAFVAGVFDATVDDWVGVGETLIKGSAVLGVTGTVKSSRSVLVSLDDAVNVLNEAGKMKVCGMFEVTGTVTIPNDSIANATLANMAQSTIKGRAAGAGTGDPTDLTANQVSTILDAATDPFLRTSAGGGGDVDGPASSVEKEVALFDGTTGKLLERATGTGIARVASGVWGTPGNVVESEITLADNTTNDVGITKHGFAPKAPNDATKYLDGTGAYTVPAGGSASDSFKTIVVAGQSDVVADSPTDTLTLVAGANVTLTTNAGTDAVTIAAAAGSGDSTTTDAEASKPAASNDGNLFLPNNGIYLWRDTGAVWAPWGPIFPLTAPVDGDFAWINQGGASVDATKGGIYLEGPAGSTIQLRIRKKAAPSTPYTITVALKGWPGFHLDNQSFGILFRNAGAGTIATYMVTFASSSGCSMASTKWTSATAFSATYATARVLSDQPLFLRIADDGTNRICSFSKDGQHFIPFHTVGRTDFLTADEVGFFVEERTNVYPVGMTLFSWKEA